jgi:hypothetical protein
VTTKKNFTENRMTLSWRITWYSVLIWIVAIVIGGFVIMPWFYLVLPLCVLVITTIYFKKGDKTLKQGLWVAMMWFFVGVALDIFEIVGPYYMNAELYFSDARNWLKYPLILLIPFIYSIILEGARFKKTSKKLSPPGLGAID